MEQVVQAQKRGREEEKMPPPSADISTLETVHSPRKSAHTNTSALAVKRGAWKEFLFREKLI